MKQLRKRTAFCQLMFFAVFAISPVCSYAQFLQPLPPPTAIVLPVGYGPYSGHFLVGGRGLVKAIAPNDPMLAPHAQWSLSAWIEFTPVLPRSVLIAGVGNPAEIDSRFFALVEGQPALRLGERDVLTSTKAFTASGWHLFSACFDGETVRLYVDGAEVAHGPIHAGAVTPELAMAPVPASCGSGKCDHFGGRIAHFFLGRDVLSAKAIAEAAASQPDFRLIDFEEGSKPWALQIVQFAGNTAPQDPATLPQPHAPFSKPKVEPPPPSVTTLAVAATRDWTLSGGWTLAAAPDVLANAAQIATPGFSTKNWMAANVPGTVLTTLIARGIYPDPDYGLDNLAIPESLNKQSYWYRAEFPSPIVPGRAHFSLVLDGINYQSEVWFNSEHLGSMKGAFIRGVFDVSKLLRPEGQNALAILVKPPPHPGIPNEQSIAFGAGLNGGAMAIDGPTFMATEGWDWFPPMRDRNTGLWQDVHLVASGAVTIKDPQVITHLPLPDTSSADITINVPLTNCLDKPVNGALTASFEGVSVTEQITLAPGETSITLSPVEFSQMHLSHPRLWWPNGYGQPELYHLKLSFAAEGSAPAETELRFGVREVTYEMSLLDNTGALRQVEYSPTVGRDKLHPQVDVTHEGMRQVPDGWAASIAAGEDASPAFHTMTDARAKPYLILKVNGVRIAARGGSWGMDDSRKRISREHLEPYFRFDRDANLNIIRNWQGQNTEETFYELADEYGMMVWNDFWEVTTDSNAEAEDPQLFLNNAEDTLRRYRNHPSIVIWCGRNEGVPQPVINRGLIELTHALDGTRYYSPSSNQINLQTSGPYSYEEPADYYTKLDRGFAVEVGTPSLPTLEWFSRWLPAVDRWPISDDWAYHNWHPHDEFNKHLEAQFGAADSLEDYERKAQMMNYVDYRAIFEGFNAHLWSPNTGRLLWMAQPAWPSTLWGIISSDYDTQASYYATKKACEPIHVQLDLSNNEVDVVNTTREMQKGLALDADIYNLNSKLLLHRELALDAQPDDITQALTLDLAPLMHGSVVLVRLQLRSQDGALLSDNLYWRAGSDKDYRALNDLKPSSVLVTAQRRQGADEHRISVDLKNTSDIAALDTKLVVFYADDHLQVLPAYYSDNYISLLPGQGTSVTIDLPAGARYRKLRLQLRGWNAIKTSVDLAP